MEEITIQDLINNMPWLSPEQKKLLTQYKLVQGDESFTDVDNKIIYYTGPEFAYHEAYHAIGDNQDFENKYSEFFHNLNDERIQELGGDLNFVKRFENDPGHFYHPSEVLARVMASNYMLQQNGITPDAKFFQELRNTPDKYGDNLRDLLYMYNDTNLEKLFSISKFEKGGKMDMKETIIKISDKIYLVQLAETEEERETGLSKTEKLDQDSGMLFVMPEGQSQVAFTMEDMSYDLDLIFINEDDEVYDVQYGKAGSKDPIISTSENLVKYVLEVNPNSGIKVGDELEFTDCPDCEEVDEEEINKMYVIGPDGQPQMELIGGERIISRRETKELIRKAKQAKKSKSELDYKKLGRYMFRILDGQNSRPEEYVNLE